jgi:hypothetical protein
MELWHYAGPDLHLANGHIDHSRSAYRGDLKIMAAYRELWNRLDIRDGQILWCYTEHGQRRLTGTTEREWHLRVPPDQIISCVDGLVWNRIIGSRSHVTRQMREEWIGEAQGLYPHDADACERHESMRLDQFWDEPEPPGGWWGRLLIPLETAEAKDAIIRHPVNRDWIIGEQLVSSSIYSQRCVERARGKQERRRVGSGSTQ